MTQAFNIGTVYPRIQAPLSKAGRGINYSHGVVHGLDVNFGPDAKYPDARLPFGRILHIGEGPPEVGDQKPSYGNRGMLDSMANGNAIPTFEKIAVNQYRYLGEFRVSGCEFGLISDIYPQWRVYKFTLEPFVDATPLLPSEAGLGEFAGDVDADAPPEVIASIVKRFKRSRMIADSVKKANDYTCQSCGDRTSWITASNVPYCEAHHVIPLGQSGFDSDKNLVVLCSNCHSRIHYAQDRNVMQGELREKLGI